MENRIQINGVWYVKEENVPAPPPISFNSDNVTHFEGCVYENNDYCWEATKIYKNYTNVELKGDKYDSVSINFKNKKLHSNQESEYWDNSLWFEGVLYGDSDSLCEASLAMNEEGVLAFREFLSYLKDKGWF